MLKTLAAPCSSPQESDAEKGVSLGSQTLLPPSLAPEGRPPTGDGAASTGRTKQFSRLGVPLQADPSTEETSGLCEGARPSVSTVAAAAPPPPPPILSQESAAANSPAQQKASILREEINEREKPGKLRVATCNLSFQGSGGLADEGGGCLARLGQQLRTLSARWEAGGKPQ